MRGRIPRKLSAYVAEHPPDLHTDGGDTILDALFWAYCESAGADNENVQLGYDTLQQQLQLLPAQDHLHPEYLSRIDVNHNWQETMDHYLSGYKASKKRGDELGFDVILGAEMRFPENNNDYLVFGIDEDWLRSNPYMCCMSAQEFFDKYHNEVLIIHAHPFRKGSAPVQETAIHGSEIINCNPRHENNNHLALELCLRHPEYIRLAGSDTHRIGDECRGGVSFPRRIQDSFDMKHMLETMQFQLWAPESQNFVDADIEIRMKNI